MARPRAPRKPVPARPAAPKDPQRERAWRAVQKFNRMIPTLNGFARTLTGNKRLRVQAGAVTQTNKLVIYIRPPIQLGDDLQHDRMLCDERDEARTPLCPACAQQDDIYKKVHHELAHHLGDSMAAPANYVLDDLLALVDEWHPPTVCNHGNQIKNKIRYADDYLVAFSAFSGFLEHLSQAVEDARIDSAMLNMKPGLRDQFFSFTYRTFTYGFEQENGDVMFWRDAPLNAQLIIGCLLIGSGYYIEPGWLSDEAIEILRDTKLREIMSGTHSWADVHVGAVHTIRAFRRLHELGHLQVDSCAPKEEFPSLNEPGGDEGEDSDEGDSSGEPGEGDDGTADQQPDGTEPDDRSGDDAGDPTGDGTAGDTASDGAFGDDFENEDDRSDGSDLQEGSDDAEPEGSSIPDGDGDDREDDRGQSDESEASDDEDEADAAGGDPSGSGREAPAEDQAENEVDDTEEGGSAGAGSDAATGDAGTDGVDDAPDGAGDGDGEPEPDDSGDEAIAGDTEDRDSEESGEPGPGSDEEDDDLGAEVWNEEHDSDELKAARSIEIENPGDEHEVADVMKQLHGHDDTDVELAEHAAAGHGDDDEDPYAEDDQLIVAINEALKIAVTQASFFDRASQEVGGVKEITFPNGLYRWTEYYSSRKAADFLPDEKIMGKALQVGRRAFAENKRSHRQQHLKEGRVNGRVLGKRAPLGDDRLFAKRIIPKRRDYIVGITLDCSGSNHGGEKMSRAKRAVFAQAELLGRLGIKFYITAHTGGLDRWFDQGYSSAKENEMHELMLLWVKKVDEPWNDSTRKRLAAIQPLAENYDGHTLEFHHNLLSKHQAADKVLIYYTDGAMPAANYDEEVVILEDKIQQCKKDGIGLLAVGINTDSPAQYGFDTVQVDSDEDLIKVMEQLERHILK